jgi:hypothetical protein
MSGSLHPTRSLPELGLEADRMPEAEVALR